MIGRDPICTRLPLPNHPFGAHTQLGFNVCVSIVQSLISIAIPLPIHSLCFGAFSRHCIPPTRPKNMGLGIVEPRRQGTQVPATALLLQDDLTGTTGKEKDEIVLVPRPSNTPRDPLVLPPLHHLVDFITYLLDRIGPCGRKISVSLPYASQSPSVVFRVPY